MLGKHLLGLYEKALNPAYGWQQRFAKVRELGFDFIELSVDETDERIARLSWNAKQIGEFRSALSDAGITCQSMCLSAHRRFPFGSADRATREKAHEILEKAVEFSSLAGIRVIQLAGYDVYYEESTPESVRLFEEAMEWSAAVAAGKQVMLAMEIMDTPFLNSITKHLSYENRINSPWFKVYPDLGNLSAWPGNNVAEELEKGMRSIVGVHLKDTLAVTENFGGKFKCVPFGAGCVDFAKCFGLLEKGGYRGPYMMEMWYDGGRFPEEEVTKSGLWLEEQFRRGTEGV